MALPVVALPTGTVTVAGVPIAVRGLSRSEAIHLASLGTDFEAAENFVLATGAGITAEAAKAWRDSTPADVVGPVVELIADLSGLGDDRGKASNGVSCSAISTS